MPANDHFIGEPELHRVGTYGNAVRIDRRADSLPLGRQAREVDGLRMTWALVFMESSYARDSAGAVITTREHSRVLYETEAEAIAAERATFPDETFWAEVRPSP
jgi:hypothetical protein